MEIKKLDAGNLKDFIAYCRAYGTEHDDSFLSDEELSNFQPDENNPTYILLDENHKITGAASLIIDSYFRKGRKGRFRIMHVLEPERKYYELLHNAVLSHTGDIDRMFLFIPEDRDKVGEILKSLGFNIERYSYMLMRDELDIPQPTFPDGFELKTFLFDRDEDKWCEVRNEAFARLAGSETPMTPEQISRMRNWDDHIEGGMMLLYHDKIPAGIIRVGLESYNDLNYAYIGPIALKPAYQGKGLGRSLLRAGLKFGKDNNLPKAFLTVNAENEKALQLYLKEGFKKEQVMVCYNYDTRK